MSDSDSESGEKKLVTIKNAADLQRLRIEKLMKNPDKPVVIPERPKDKALAPPPDFVRNVMGSSAGAGSGEFHVYRHLRRKEYARQKFIQEKSEKEKLDDEYHMKIEHNRRAAEERTAKKRAKRLRKKKNAKLKGKQPKKSAKQQNVSSQSDGSSSDEKEIDETPDVVSGDAIQPSVNIKADDKEHIADKVTKNVTNGTEKSDENDYQHPTDNAPKDDTEKLDADNNQHKTDNVTKDVTDSTEKEDAGDNQHQTDNVTKGVTEKVDADENSVNSNTALNKEQSESS